MKPELKYQILTGYFGKLPPYPDFIKFNAGGAEIRELDLWLQEGLLKAKDVLKDGWKTAYRNSPRYNFLYSSPETQNIVLGLMLPGNDKSDREFPFLVFLLIERKILKHTHFYLVPPGFSKSFDFINPEFKHSPGGENLIPLKEEFLNALMKKSLDDFIQYRKYLSETSIKNYYERTLGSFENPLKYKMMENLKMFSSGNRKKGSSNVPETIRISFGLNSGFAELDICFLFNLVLAFSANASEMPAVFWTTNENNIVMYLFFKKLTAENYCEMVSPVPEKNAAGIAETDENILPESFGMLDNPQTFLNELLENINKDSKRKIKLWMKIKK